MVPFRCLQLISRAFLICQPSTTGSPPNRTPDPWITSRMLYHWANRWLVHSGLYYAGIFERVSFVQCFTTATGLDNSWFTDDRINAARRLKFIIYLWYSFFSILGHFCTWYFESARVVVICELTRCGYAKSLIPWLVYLFRIPIVFPLETFEIVPIFHFWGIPRWYHFAVYSSSVGLSWFCQPSTTGTPPNRTPDPWITSRML